MLLADVAQYLDEQGIGVYDPVGVSGDIFITALPSKPESLLAIFPSGGRPPDPKLSYDSPSIQIRIRGGRDPRPAYARAMDIIALLHGASGLSLPEGTYVVSCIADQSTPIYLGMDTSGRQEYSINFSLQIYNPSGSRET